MEKEFSSLNAIIGTLAGLVERGILTVALQMGPPSKEFEVGDGLEVHQDDGRSELAKSLSDSVAKQLNGIYQDWDLNSEICFYTNMNAQEMDL